VNGAVEGELEGYLVGQSPVRSYVDGEAGQPDKVRQLSKANAFEGGDLAQSQQAKENYV